MSVRTLILGGGMTGLSAGCSTGYPVFEAKDRAGGICSSYYMLPGECRRRSTRPPGGGAYQFEFGGGHWIFGGDPETDAFLNRHSSFESYSRRSAVFFSETGRRIPFPLQDHLADLGPEVCACVLREVGLSTPSDPRTMEQWLGQQFGSTLVDLFFAPFHEKYTAGLWKHIAPQDSYKTPAHGAKGNATTSAHYNAQFRYPTDGLNALVTSLVEGADVRFGKRVSRITTTDRCVRFDDGTREYYDRLYSTLPLIKMQQLTDLAVDASPAPFTSVLVINLGATKGDRLPNDHWIYVPDARSGFHRLGFYSNVDRCFVPNRSADLVAIYAEFAYPGGEAPTDNEVQQRCDETIAELKSWRFIDRVQVVDPTWIDVAYTWNWPESNWRRETLDKLRALDIHMIGRYGNWKFQGIAESIREGLMLGRAEPRR